MRGDIDAITGFTFTSLLNLEARGAKAADVVILPYPDYGVKLYGNVIIASPKLIKENPAAVKAFLVGLHQGREGSDRQSGGRHRIASRRATASSTASWKRAASSWRSTP